MDGKLNHIQVSVNHRPASLPIVTPACLQKRIESAFNYGKENCALEFPPLESHLVSGFYV